MRTVKLSSAQISALQEATSTEDGHYRLTTAKAQTLAALARLGITGGGQYLTVQGVSAMFSTRLSDVIAGKGLRVSVDDTAESLAIFVAPPVVDDICGGTYEFCSLASKGKSCDCETVTIAGEDPSTWAPDFSAHGATECYFGCGATPVAVFVDYVGNTGGLCVAHRSSASGETYDIPARAETATVFSTVCVVQSTPGMSGLSHYHAADCRDIQREMKRYSLTESDVTSFAFSSIAEIIDFEYSDVEDGNWIDMLLHANHIDFGIKIMDCLRNTGIPNGHTDSGQLDTTGNFFCMHTAAPEMLNSHSLTFYVETENCGVKFECGNCQSIDSRGNFAAFKCEGEESPIHNAFKNDTDAGSVETMVTKEYHLFATVDDNGTEIDLGWHTFTVEASLVYEFAVIAEMYGARHGSGTPRHGWADIIGVADVCDI